MVRGKSKNILELSVDTADNTKKQKEESNEKIIIIFLSITLVLSLIGCGNEDKVDESATSDLESSVVDSNTDSLDKDVDQEEDLAHEQIKDEAESEEIKDEGLGGVALLSIYITDKEMIDSIDSPSWENVPVDKTVIEFSYAF